MYEPSSTLIAQSIDVPTNRRSVLQAGLALAAGAVIASGRSAHAAESSPVDASAADARLLPGFKVHKIKTSGATLHTVVGGSGPPLLLIHGAPLSHLSWFRVAPELAKTHTVVAPDLRGYGDSTKPEDGDKHINYSKRAMAQDKIELMHHFGFDKFAVVGHDRGGRVAHRLALDHPDAVTRMAVLDIVPTYYLYTHVTKAFVDAYFHWFLYIRPAPFPETVIASNLGGFGGRGGGGGGPPELQVLRAEYERINKEPANIHGMCEDYRASAGIDMEFDQADLDKKIACPLHVLWAKNGSMGKMYDVLGIWKERGTQVTGAAMPGGHAFQEDHPQETLAELIPFLAG
jgi:haloacetate dehalogenase